MSSWPPGSKAGIDTRLTLMAGYHGYQATRQLHTGHIKIHGTTHLKLVELKQRLIRTKPGIDTSIIVRC